MGESNRELYAPQIIELTKALKAEREKAGLSQRALAERARIVQHHLCAIEGGTEDMLVSTLLAILDALELDATIQPEDAWNTDAPQTWASRSVKNT